MQVEVFLIKSLLIIKTMKKLKNVQTVVEILYYKIVSKHFSRA